MNKTYIRVRLRNVPDHLEDPITQLSFDHQAIRRGSFTSFKQPIQHIDHFVGAHNQNALPFRLSATVDSLFEKLHRLCSRITETGR